MTIVEFFNEQNPERKKALTAIHKVIVQTHSNINPRIGKMMGQQMAIYEIDGAFLYALGSGQAHMSFHNILIYSNKPLYEKYAAVFKEAKFQKGCINFHHIDQLPNEQLTEFMKDCVKAAPAYLKIYKERAAKKK